MFVHTDCSKNNTLLLFLDKNCKILKMSFLLSLLHILQQINEQLVEFEKEADATMQVYRRNLISEAALVVMR